MRKKRKREEERKKEKKKRRKAKIWNLVWNLHMFGLCMEY